jgi:hypothetical protein
MHHVLLVSAVATALLGAVPADAATRHKRHVPHAPRITAQTAVAPVQRQPQLGPAWSGPNQCWSDDGYGRYSPCGDGKGGM